MGALPLPLGDRLFRGRRSWHFRQSLAGGLSTAVYVASHPRRSTRIGVVALEPAQSLRAWARQHGVADAIGGGYHVGPALSPLGELWTGGDAHMCVPFDPPWDASRACVVVARGRVEIAPRGALPGRIAGDLLQAGPLLVAGGRSLIAADRDPEGFGAGAHQFDTDITRGRHPRSALGLSRDRILAVACDGNSLRDAGMTLGELAELMIDLGAETAINLGGGGSASLIAGGRLQNRPRDPNGIPLLGGRPVASALVLDR